MSIRNVIEKKCFSKKNEKIKIVREEMWVKNVRVKNVSKNIMIKIVKEENVRKKLE